MCFSWYIRGVYGGACVTNVEKKIAQNLKKIRLKEKGKETWLFSRPDIVRHEIATVQLIYYL